MDKQLNIAKKIAVFSDIHGNFEALQSILDDIKLNDFDEVIYLGDAISLGPQPKECLELLKNSNVRFILGNHELYYLYGSEIDDAIKPQDEKEHYTWVKNKLDESDREYLEKCNLCHDKEKFLNEKLLFAHFLLKDEKARYPFESFDLRNNIDAWLKNNMKYIKIFIGHEHDAFTQDDVLGVNDDFEKTTGVLSNIWLVGSSGCTKDNMTTYTSIEIGAGMSITQKYLPYDREKFLEKLAVTEYPYKDRIVKFAFGVSIEELENIKNIVNNDF